MSLSKTHYHLLGTGSTYEKHKQNKIYRLDFYHMEEFITNCMGVMYFLPFFSILFHFSLKFLQVKVEM